MTIHYHGLPITPNAVLQSLAGRHFCVRYGAHSQVKLAHQIGQSIILDNGAYPAWKKGAPVDWPGFYRFCEEWLAYMTTWAVVPDIIDGTEEANDALIAQWPHGARGAPVWHMHESLGRLLRLAERWPRICIGSSKEFAVIGTSKWHRRMAEAMNALCPSGAPSAWLHMLRGLALCGSEYPFASADSTNIGRNHHRPRNSAASMAERLDARQCPGWWRWSNVDPDVFAMLR